MRIFATLITMLLAVPALAVDGWTAGTPIENPPGFFDQTFTYTFTATGTTAKHLDVSACHAPLFTISSADAQVELFDCPAADSARSECQAVRTLPVVDPVPGPSSVVKTSANATFRRGFAMVRVLDTVPAGTVTAACADVPGQFMGGIGDNSWTTARIGEVRSRYNLYTFDNPADDSKCGIASHTMSPQSCNLGGDLGYQIMAQNPAFLTRMDCNLNVRTNAGAPAALTFYPWWNEGDGGTDVQGTVSPDALDLVAMNDGDKFTANFNEWSPFASGGWGIQGVHTTAEVSSVDVMCIVTWIE